MKIGTLFCFGGFPFSYLGVSLRVGLSAHTAQALATGPVSAPIPHANHSDKYQIRN